MRLTMKLSDISWDEAKDYINTVSNHLIIPVGTCEQHGYHLPLGNDTLVVERMAKMLSNATGMLITPTINYSINLPCDKLLSGTTSISHDILRSTIISITDWWSHQGIEHFILLTYHGDPFHIDAMTNLKDNITLIELYDIDYSDILEKQSTAKHACEAETSIALYLFPDEVHMEKIKEYDIPFDEFKECLYHQTSAQLKGYVGCLGFPSYATKDKGKVIVGRMYDRMLSQYNKLLNSKDSLCKHIKLY